MSSRSQPSSEGTRRSAGGTWGDLDAQRLHAMVNERLFGGPPPPQKIGRFRVERRIGAGAMGVVYAAFDDQLGRRVAIKLLHPHLAGDDLGRARLLREAKAMARLEHDHVVRVYESGAWGDQVFVAMEFVEGVTLDAWLKAAPRRWTEVLAIFLQAGRALAAAHRAGVLHRDFKPENVLVDAQGRARVLDFGLACAIFELKDRGVDDDMLEPLTRTGSILGTPAYMAPEQLRTGNAEARSDQFSFCVALYEGLYGARPFDGAPRFGPLRIEHVPKDSRVPARVRRILLRGLAEAPEQRWPGMDALLAALARPAISRPWWIAGGAAGGALAAGGLAVGLMWWREAAYESAQTEASQIIATLEARVHGQEGALASEQAAREQHARALRVLRAASDVLADDPTAALLILRELDEPDPLVWRALAGPISGAILTGHEGPVLRVEFSETGDAIHTVDGAGRARRFLAGGQGRGEDLGDAAPVDPRRSPDGALALVERAGGLALLGEDGGATPLRGASGPLVAAAWSPDGARIAAATRGGELVVWPRGGGKPQALDRRGAGVRVLAWSQRGDRLAAGRDDGSIDVWQTRGRKPRRIAGLSGHAGPIAALAFSGDGRWLVSGSDDDTARIWGVGHDAAASQMLRGHTGPVRAVGFDGDGRRVVSGSDDGTARVWSLRPMALAEWNLERPINTVAWSPDGALLAAGGDDGLGVWVVAPAGDAAPRQLEHPGTVYAIAWSPDGQTLATADSAGAVRLWPREGDAPPVLVPGRRGPLLALAWHPRGDRFAAAGLDEVIWIWPIEQVESARRVALRRGNVEGLAFDPTGARLAAATDDGVLALVGDAEDAPMTTVDLGEALNDFAWSPDGAALALASDRRAVLHMRAGATEASLIGRHAVPVWSVAWDPRDRMLASGGSDGEIRLWPRGDGGPDEVLHGHGDAVHTLAFDARGDRLASGGADGRVIVWPLAETALRARLEDATTACLSPLQRERLLGEVREEAQRRAAACEARAGRGA